MFNPLAKKMRKMALALMIFALLVYSESYAEKYDFKVSKSDITNGYIAEKIPLKNYIKPSVNITNAEYISADVLPVNAIPSNVQDFDILLGKERKQAFAVIRIPAYRNGEGGFQQLSAITIEVTEANTIPENSARKTTADNSPLMSGNWYKIAVPATGFYKVDFNFLASKLGISGNVSSANIRVFGSGGNMLSEDNAVPRKANLTEIAIAVNDGNGDGTFGQGDYFIFYGKGPIAWTADAPNSKFNHTKNLYEDKGYYFLNFDAPGKRVNTQPGTLTGNVNVTSYNDYHLHEEDLSNPPKYGKNWVGEEFGFTGSKVDKRSFDFELGNLTDNARVKIVLGSVSESNSNIFTVYRNNLLNGTYTLGSATGGDNSVPIYMQTASSVLPGVSGKQTIRIEYQSTSNNAIGYLDYIEINTRKALAFDGNTILFRDINSIGISNNATYSIGNSDASVRVWDVTDPYTATAMNGSLNGGTYSFVQAATSLHEFAAIKGDQAGEPEYVSKIDNQNLHATGPVDYVIATPGVFKSAADRLADFHRQRGMRVLVTTFDQIYNEFSSGGQDISGIRDFMRMLYENAGTDTANMPKYLLLFGDASYDYKNRISNNTNYAPTFETLESINSIDNYCGDDFFGFLDDNENIENNSIVNTLDVGVGRLPVKNIDEANTVVDKIIHYKSAATLGPWRLATTIVADNEDNAGPHLEDGEIMEAAILSRSTLYNTTKIYEDAIPFISTPGGDRAPDANKSINDQMFRGTFLLNYSGHGNPEVLSHERIITSDDFNKWNSLDHMPIMVTATCDFGQFDRPDFISAAEQIILKKDGGAISSITTVKLVYQNPNRKLNQDYLDAQFQRVNGKWHTFGDALRIGKNKTYSNGSTASSDIINFRKFALLGDPALEPNFPEYYIYTQDVKDGITGVKTDTINALGSYTVNGYVGDINGNVLSNFSGRLSVIIFDKPRIVKTLTSINKTFSVRNNIIYKGKATVTDGKFSVAFIAPKDINYDMGKGKVSYYAENGITDAAGSDFKYYIGGYSDHPVVEDNPPVVRPYIGDSMFINGGLTGSNPLLYAILEDETGINVSGNAVGHDLTAILDGHYEASYILNDYYETETNTYKRGYVNFPMYNIPDGRHRIVVKAWDVNNNSGTGTVDFEVMNGNVMKVQNLMNYPNPFRDKTHFIFEHNHPDEYLYAELNVYSSLGMLVRTIKQVYQAGMGRSKELIWDGTDNNGTLLPSGVYMYKMMITTDKGAKDMAYQKLVIAR